MLIRISPKFVLKGPINRPVLAQVMAEDAKVLPEPKLTQFTDA